MWFGNSLIRIGICCNSEMLGLMAGGCFGVFASSLLSSLPSTSISATVVK